MTIRTKNADGDTEKRRTLMTFAAMENERMVTRRTGWHLQPRRALSTALTAVRGWTVVAMPKRINPRRRPATQADVQRAKDTATADACRVTLAIFFTALLDKEGMGAEQLQRIWREVEALSESVRDGYVSAPDLIRVLREEYEIDIVGG